MNEFSIGPRGLAFTTSIVLWILGSAAVAWLSFYSGVRYMRREISMEQRRAESVGAVPLPTGNIEVVIDNRTGGHLFIESASIDGKELRAYYVNKGTHSQEFVKFHWQLLSPDGTVIKQDYSYENFGSRLEPGVRVETVKQIESDTRVKRIRLFMGD